MSNRSAEGPYVVSDVAIGERATSFWDGVTQHNPAITRAPDGTWLLFYMGSTQAGAKPSNCTWPKSVRPGASITRRELEQLQEAQRPLSPENSVLEFNQRVGLATAKTPYGPWNRPAQPLLEPRKGHFDDGFTTNPSPAVLPNGSIVLLYKSRPLSGQGMFTAVAHADSYLGPYTRPHAPLELPTNCEDADIFLDTNPNAGAPQGVYRVVMHCACTYQLMWSTDGQNFNKTGGEQPWCDVTYQDGATEKLSRRERPKWILNTKGGLVAFSTGVQPTASHDKNSFTMMAPVSSN